MIFELRSIVHGRFVFISTGYFAGSRHGEEKSMPEAGLRPLGQGSWIRTQSRGGSDRVETWCSENGNYGCGRVEYSVEVS